MAIPRLTSLSFSIYNNPGAYALLLGSGVSRAANIPTGWDIACDLIRKVAIVDGKQIKGNIEEWYEKEYGTSISYSDLLDKLASSSTERVQLMHNYFEPDETDIELGYKKPTKAHKSIAQLMANGYIKVVITTNFDRLLESALEAIGVIPQVVYKDEDWDTITPIVHSKRPTIIKLNGDYIDCTFRNTELELDHYPVRTTKQLQWIFENYGIITCGWSGEWDYGLKNVIRTASNSRYGIYFTYLSKISKSLKELAKETNGQPIEIKDANNLFMELNERVDALSRMEMSNDLDDKIIVARIKKYLSKNEYRILYSELIQHLSFEAVEEINVKANYNFYLTEEKFEEYLDIHVKAVHSLLLVTPYICHWGNQEQLADLGDTIVKLCLVNINRWTEYSNFLHSIAAVLLFNCVGICCVKFKRFKELNKILSLTVPEHNFMDYRREKILYLIGDSHLGKDRLNNLLSQKWIYPYSMVILTKLKPYLENLFFNEDEYKYYFDIWEHLKSLVYGFKHCYILDVFSIPLGLFIHDRVYYERESEDNPYNTFFSDAKKLKLDWGPIKQGMFDGKYSEYEIIYKKAEEYYKKYWRG